MIRILVKPIKAHKMASTWETLAIKLNFRCEIFAFALSVGIQGETVTSYWNLLVASGYSTSFGRFSFLGSSSLSFLFLFRMTTTESSSIDILLRSHISHTNIYNQNDVPGCIFRVVVNSRHLVEWLRATTSFHVTRRRFQHVHRG